MGSLIELIANNSIAVVCVGYLIYFQSTTMDRMLKTLNSINERLIVIENKVGVKDEG